MPKGIKAAKVEKVAPEKKLTSTELVSVGQFAVRVGKILAGLEAEKKSADEKLTLAEQNHHDVVVAVNAKIDLIVSDPVKYFKILDTQGDSTYSNLKSAANTAGGLAGTSTATKVNADDNTNLTKERLDKILNELASINSNSRGIGDMIYEETRRRENSYHNRGRDYFR